MTKFVFETIAKDGKLQKFNTYFRRSDGKHVTRFYVNNYKTHSQWCGRGCTFYKESDARAFGHKIAAAVEKACDVNSIKKLVNLHADYMKAFK